eukprot:762830-Hanusia_phi.AAC.1
MLSLTHTVATPGLDSIGSLIWSSWSCLVLLQAKYARAARSALPAKVPITTPAMAPAERPDEITSSLMDVASVTPYLAKA